MNPPKILVKIGGSALLNEAALRRLASDLRAVHDTGARLLVVHGGGPQATALARQLGLEPDFRGGRRVTDAAMLSVVKHALVGEAGTTLLAACRAVQLPAVSMSASSGGLVVASRRPPTRVKGVKELVDFGYVADVKAVDETVLECLWAGGFIPILSSVVIDESGQALNLNADTLVAALGKHLRVDSVCFVADVPGVFANLDEAQSHIPSLTPSQVDKLVAQGVVRGGMVAKLTEMSGLIDAGVTDVWIVGLHEECPISSAILGAPGRRTKMSAD